jgi:DNA mismatch endonuclease (patch repair protein)
MSDQLDIGDGYCLCGCGETTIIYRGKHRRFIYGHHTRGKHNPRYGIILSTELKEKIAATKKINNKSPGRLGKKHSEETKKLISEKKKGIATTPRQNLDIKCPICDNFFYIKKSRQDKNAVSYCSLKCKNEDYKNRFSGEKNPFYGEKHDEKALEKMRIAGAGNRSHKAVLPSKPEKMVHEELNKLNIIFETEKLINNKFCVDIFIPDRNLIIYVDGCYWHACPQHCPLAPLAKNDKSRKPYLTKCGYNVEIIWEHDIKIMCGTLISNIIDKYPIKMIE